MNIKRATLEYKQYFSLDVLEHGFGYVVYDDQSIIGMFSFMIEENNATLNFPFCLNKQAIKLALDTFLSEHEDVLEVKNLSRQNLNQLGFINNLYKR